MVNIGNKELERRFDNGEDIAQFMEMNALRRPNMAYVAENRTSLTNDSQCLIETGYEPTEETMLAMLRAKTKAASMIPDDDPSFDNVDDFLASLED